jgi:methylase of polypeptide subunit release factors
VDVNENAIDCAKHNVRINNLEDIISVFESDIFSNVTSIDYDVIIANLPIVNFNAEDNKINNALYDGDFKLHKRLFEEVKDHLSPDGYIAFTHANLQSKETDNPMGDFEELEDLVKNHGLRIAEKVPYEDLGYNWIYYKLSK